MSLKQEREAARRAAEEALRNTELPQELQALKDHFGEWLEVRQGKKGPYLSREVMTYGFPSFLVLADELRNIEEAKLSNTSPLFEGISVTAGLYDKSVYLNFFTKGQEPQDESKKSGPQRGRNNQKSTR